MVFSLSCCRVQSIKPEQMNVKHRLWRGRVHCTMARDPDDVTATSVFSDWTIGDSVKAKVIDIREKRLAS